MKKYDHIKFIVLSEDESTHHVAIRRDDSHWLQITATFPNKTRAESYACVENDMIEDDYAGLHGTDAADENPPNLPEPPPGTERIIEHRRERSVTVSESVFKHSASPSMVQERAEQIKGVAGEVLAVLPALIKEFPKGPTAKIISSRIAIEENYVRRAIRVLEDQGGCELMKRKDSPAWHVIPVGYTPPIEDLTAAQSAVLGVLKNHVGKDQVATLSFRQLCDSACISKGNIVAVLDALEYKKRIECVRRGGGTEMNQYRILPTPPHAVTFQGA